MTEQKKDQELRGEIGLIRLLHWVAWVLLTAPQLALAADARQAVMPGKHATVFKTYCYDCHDASSEEAGVNLEDLDFKLSRDIGTVELWAKVLNAINSGEMPPEDSEPIPDEAKLAFLEDLTGRMVEARKILGDSGGVIPLRRLNRREYANTIEALLGVQPDVSSLPDDQLKHSFDTQGASLFMSSEQIEQYLAAARSALQRCYQTPTELPQSINRIEPEEKYTKHYRDYLESLRANYEKSVAFQSQSEKPATDFGLIDAHQADVYVKHYEVWHQQLEQYLQWPETKTGAALIMTIKGGGMTRIKIPTLKPQRPGDIESASGRVCTRKRNRGFTTWNLPRSRIAAANTWRGEK